MERSGRPGRREPRRDTLEIRTLVRFTSLVASSPLSNSPPKLRWPLAGPPEDQEPLSQELRDPHSGHDELAGLEFFHVNAKRIINAVPEAANLPFRFTINPYRGCSHACVYCFARPTHEYLDLNPGTDFDSRIIVKVNAPERLRAELKSPRWTGEAIALGTNTDPYQRCEGRYRLTRRILETLVEFGNPFSILTKSTLILRDLDLLVGASKRGHVEVAFSVGSVDREVWRRTEPGTPNPLKRLEAVAALNAAGVPCGVLIAPILPGISDHPAQIREVVRASVEAGATDITAISLHLRPGVREHYLSWLGSARPDLVAGHLARYRYGANLPAEERRRLGAEVRRLVDRERARQRPAHKLRPAPSRIRQTARRAQGGDNPDRQLTLPGLVDNGPRADPAPVKAA